LLRQRILSALILAPLALAMVWFSAWTFAALVAVAGGLMGWEWSRLCLGGFGRSGIVMACMAVAIAVLGTLAPVAGLAVIAVAAVLAPTVDRVAGRSPLWLVAGAIYIGLPSLALVWLRAQGRETLIWLLLVVWATDVGAYAAGCSIGGPKLWPKISPKKTWAGLAGGIALATLIGAVAARFAGIDPFVLAGVSGGLAVVAQAGDLAESCVKRHFGVKDSSGIIPGHGGVLDRLDGLLAASPVAAALCLAVGGGLLEWRWAM
jgi:phosphatidate cytidylyltransferase